MQSTTPSGVQRRAVLLQYATIAWNLGEAGITISLGLVGGSLALVGFGADAIIEVFASAVVVWHLRGELLPVRTRWALHLVGAAFYLLAAALAAAAVHDLALGRQAEASWWGIVYLSLAAMAMFGLALAKRRLAKRLGSEPFSAEAEMTFLDGLLSVTTLSGLALNATLRWWWADPAAGLFIALMAVRDGRESYAEAAGLMQPTPSEDRSSTS